MKAFILLSLLLSCGLFSNLSRAADIERGQVVAKVRCMPCHHLDAHSRSVGPGLKGVYGRAPSINGVPFKRWDESSLEQWLANPRIVKPNTAMMIPPISLRDRTDIIAWLRSREERALTGRD